MSILREGVRTENFIVTQVREGQRPEEDQPQPEDTAGRRRLEPWLGSLYQDGVHC